MTNKLNIDISFKNKTKLIYFIVPCLITLFSIFSVYFFVIGFHNIDLAYNMASASECVDTGNDNIVRNRYELYSLGINQIFYSLSIFIANSIIGLELSIILCNSQKYL